MVKNSKIPLFFGINIQFIVYFLLFAYVPLMVISIFGYFLNKDILTEYYYQNLTEMNKVVKARLAEYLSGNQERLATGVHLLKTYANDDILLNPASLNTLDLAQDMGFYKVKLQTGDLRTEYNDHPVYLDSLFMVFTQATPEFMISAYLPLADMKEKLSGSGLPFFNKLMIETGDSSRTFFSVTADTVELANDGMDSGEDVMRVQSEVLPGWILYSGRKDNGLFVELRELLVEIIIGNILVGILLLTMAFLLARRISHPIRSLIASIHEISQGDLSQPVRIKSKDEIKLLADEFELMRQKLLESYSNLENKIEARTKQLKEAQFQISHQEKMASLGLMAAGIAHEIGNPLTSISSMAQIIKRKTDDKHIVAYITTIVKNIERISKIVRELVDFARPSSYEAALVNVNDVVKNVVGIVRYDRRSKHINIQLDLEPDLPELHLVEDQLYQVFFNILINAVDAVKDKDDRITVRSYQKDHKLHIRFEDTGIGIPDKVKNRIFEPFYTTKGVGKGTGLGLSVSYGIIKNLNGEIRLESEPGEGSVFTVVLPVNRQENSDEDEYTGR